MYPPSVSDVEVDLRRCAALLEIVDVVVHYHDPADLFRDLTSRLRAIVPFDCINFALHEPAPAKMQLYTWEGSEWPRQPLEFPVEETLLGGDVYRCV